jgi:hypothetical protein
MRKRPIPNFKESSGVDRVSHASSLDPKLCVTVLATTPEGTKAALNAATWLAKDLEARVTLLAMQVVPNLLPVDKPPVSLDFTTKQQQSLVLASGAKEEDVDIRICVCRDRDSGLLRALRRRTLVVIGGKRHWWLSSEERLERSLRRLGHHVIFIDVGHRADRTSPDSVLLSFGRGSGQFQTRASAAGPSFERKDSR